MTDRQLLLVFVKNQEEGKVKTRLAKTIGNRQALYVYRKLLQKTREAIQPLQGTDIRVCYANFLPEKDLFTEVGYEQALQHPGSLGERMTHAFRIGFANGYTRICIIGSDCWDLDHDILEEAFSSLQAHDFVIGPANDGGFYLLGMNSFTESLFNGKTYSTGTVYQEAITEIRKAGKTVAELRELTDIDTYQDLQAAGLTHLLE